MLSDMLFQGKSFKKWYLDGSDNYVTATALFIINYIVPLLVGAGVLALIIALDKEDEAQRNKRQPVPVNKTVMWNPKTINKKTTISYADAQKLLAQIRTARSGKVK